MNNINLNTLTSFLKAQQEQTRSAYQIINGLVDDYCDDSAISSMGSWIQNDDSNLITDQQFLVTSDGLVALFHFEGTHGDITSTDSGPLHLPVTLNDVLISQTQKRAGNTSAYFSGSGNVETQQNSAFDIDENENFTIEVWINTSGATFNYRTVFAHHSTDDPDSKGISLYINPFDVLSLEINYNAYMNEGSATVADNNWHHIALTRSGSNTNNLKLFVDGNIDIQTTYTGSITPPMETLFRLGASRFDSDPYTGYMDEFRVLKGISRYSSSFIPSTASFSNSEFNTVQFTATSSLISKFVSSSNVPTYGNILIVVETLSGSINNLNVALTRNSGSTYNSASLLLMSSWDFDSNAKIYQGTTDFSNQSVGSKIGYKITSPVTNSIYRLLGTVLYTETASIEPISSSWSVTSSAAAPNFRCSHIVGNSSTPTLNVGSGLGGGTSLSITGSDLCGKLGFTAGVIPLGSAPIFHVTFSVPYTTSPIVCLQPANLSATTLEFTPYVVSTTNGFSANVGVTLLGSLTAYTYNYMVMQ